MQKQLHLSDHPLLVPDEFQPVRNDAMTIMRKKPAQGTGLWTSTYVHQRSAWVDWCIGHDFSDPYAQYWLVLTPDPAARIYTIDTRADLMTLLQRYPFVHPSSQHFFMPGPLQYYFLGIDFERMSQDYDALHLTSRGNIADVELILSSWDCESTVWFRWMFTALKDVTPAQAKERAT